MSRDKHLRNVLTKQDRIAEIARTYTGQPIVSVAHHIDLEWLYVAYLKTRKDGALGVDSQSAEDYAEELKGNLSSLINRLKLGTYRAPAVRRVHIPKGKGKETRPLGIPTFEDKVLQRAVLMAIAPIFEQDFYDFSFGFREGRSAHQALKYLRNGLMKIGGGWVIDLDIRKYFDSINHAQLRETFKQRVCDGIITRVIGKWLKAGIMEAGQVSYMKAGTPQGGVISPLLSNIFLHEVLDSWFVKEVRPRLKGKGFIVRYADDAVLVFEKKADALRVLEVLPKRFGKYNLTLHPDKTRLVGFVRPEKDDKDKCSGSFSFLGFTFYWGRSRKGKTLVKWKTEKSRLSRSIRKVYLWLKQNRHRKLRFQYRKLCQMIKGHYAYFGLSLNGRSLGQYFYHCMRSWRKWLSKRSRKHRMKWENFCNMLKHYALPPPRIIHSLWSEALT